MPAKVRRLHEAFPLRSRVVERAESATVRHLPLTVRSRELAELNDAEHREMAQALEQLLERCARPRRRRT
jgi:hypothetical protein